MRFLNIHHARETIGRLVSAVNEKPLPTAAAFPAACRSVVSALRPLPVEGEGITLSFKDSEWGSYLIENRTFENIFEGLESTPADLRDPHDIAPCAGIGLGIRARVGGQGGERAGVVGFEHGGVPRGADEGARG
ncbi:hypothetical protein ACWC9T_04665 [Kitasatospora sp. NPDC001159]